MPHFYVSASESTWEYSTFIITLNFMLFVYMVVVYVFLYKKASGKKVSASTKKDTNKGMQTRISRLLLTDFFCWIPVCVMAYLSVAGVSLSPNAYIVSAGFLLPINSAMNPLLYSKRIGNSVSRARKSIMKNLLSIRLRHVGDTTKFEKTGRKQIDLKVVRSSGQSLQCY